MPTNPMIEIHGKTKRKIPTMIKLENIFAINSGSLISGLYTSFSYSALFMYKTLNRPHLYSNFLIFLINVLSIMNYRTGKIIPNVNF